MAIAQLIPLALKLSIMAIVFSLGLTTRPAGLMFLVRRPWLLARSLGAMNLIMPLFAIAAIALLRPGIPTASALIALSLSPVPPLLPRKQVRAGGDSAYAVCLLLTASLFAIVWVPVAIEIVERVVGVPLAVAPIAVAKVVGALILAPLLVGVLIGHLARGAAERAAPILAIAANLVLAAGVILILIKFWHAVIAQIGNGTVWALVGFVVVGLLVGHLLGGPGENDRTVLATAAASRHPGLALTIVNLNFPDMRAAPAVILLYLILSGLICMPYIAWRRRVGGSAPTPAPAPG
jgi:bile acid:Na+ symporter, BASS family